MVDEETQEAANDAFVEKRTETDIDQLSAIEDIEGDLGIGGSADQFDSLDQFTDN